MFDEQKPHPLGVAGEILQERGINRLRIASAEELLGRGAALVDETGREGGPGGSNVLLTAQATRAVHTFEAIIGTCVLGRGVQGAMLNRSLYEDVLGIHWVAENPKLAPERAEEHDRLIALAEHKLESTFGRTDRPLTEEEGNELDELIDLYGGPREAFTADWHRASFSECFELVKARWREHPEASGYFDYIYDVMQRRNNLMLHPSPTAFRQTFITVDGKRRLNRAGPDERWIQALADGSGAFYMVMRVLAEEFDLDKDPSAESFSRTTEFLKEIEANDLQALPDDAECPCGTGLRVAECHRS
jgi:hypothetical protein